MNCKKPWLKVFSSLFVRPLRKLELEMTELGMVLEAGWVLLMPGALMTE